MSVLEIFEKLQEIVGDIFSGIFSFILGIFTFILSAFGSFFVNVFSTSYSMIVKCGKSFFTFILDILPIGLNGTSFSSDFIYFFIGTVLCIFILRIIINGIISFISNLL